MKEFLISILGTYVPTTYEYIEYSPDGEAILQSVIPAGVAGVDWLYVLSGLLIIVCVWSVFRLLGGLICRNS